jgi:DNA topoisomerase-3
LSDVRECAVRDAEGLRLYPQVAGKTLTLNQVESLLTTGRTAVIKGFKSKAGKAFDAPLQLTAEGKVAFVMKKR